MTLFFVVTNRDIFQESGLSNRFDISHKNILSGFLTKKNVGVSVCMFFPPPENMMFLDLKMSGTVTLFVRIHDFFAFVGNDHQPLFPSP